MNLFLSYLLTALTMSSFQQQDLSGLPTDLPAELSIEENTRKLLTEFIINENMEAVAAMLDDGIKFHWPNKMIVDKASVMEACSQLVKRRKNTAEVIDVTVKDNVAYILWIWAGTIEFDENPEQIGKEFFGA